LNQEIFHISFAIFHFSSSIIVDVEKSFTSPGSSYENEMKKWQLVSDIWQITKEARLA